MLKIIFPFFFFLLTAQLRAQALLVVDEKDQPLAYYSLIVGNNKEIQIGDFEGKVYISNPQLHCNYTVRYLGYKPQSFCWEISANEIKIIKLIPEFVDLPATQIRGFSDKELINLSKGNLRKMAEKFNLARSFFREEASNYTMESFGVLTLGGLINRSQKTTQFNHGNMGFISQYSRFWIDSEKLVPLRSKMSSVTTFTQDLLFEIITFKNSNWKLDASIVQSEEVFVLERLNSKVHLNFDGSLKKIVFSDRLHKDSFGRSFYYSGEIYFIMDNENQFFSQLNYRAYSDKEKFEISCKILDIPQSVRLPQNYFNASKIQGLMNAIGSFTDSPDYNFDAYVFDKLLKEAFPKHSTLKKERQELLTMSYKYHEVYKSHDSSSLRYLSQNSDFIQELIKTLKNYELVW